MPEIERLTITVPPELAAVVKQAVETGDYASTSEVVRAALRDWKLKRALQIEELAALSFLPRAMILSTSKSKRPSIWHSPCNTNGRPIS
jgi:putative addiction module CopG family antidote